MSTPKRHRLKKEHAALSDLIRPLFGSTELINGIRRYCIWIDSRISSEAQRNTVVAEHASRAYESRIGKCSSYATKQLASEVDSPASERLAKRRRNRHRRASVLVQRVAIICPFDLMSKAQLSHNRNYGIYDGATLELALIASRIHWVWMSTVCGRLEDAISHTRTLSAGTLFQSRRLPRRTRPT